MPGEAELPAREAMDFDVVIVGAGPAGLAAAIHLKQVDAHLNVVVVEKGSAVGGHILSGVVIDPAALVAEIARVKEKGVTITPQNLLIAENAKIGRAHV